MLVSLPVNKGIIFTDLIRTMDLQQLEKDVIEICKSVGEFIKKEGGAFDRIRRFWEYFIT